MRFRLFGGLLAAAALLCAQPALADNYTLKDTSATTITLRSRLIGGITYPVHLLYGMFGGTPTAVTTDASGNLNVNVVSGGAGGSTTTKANASTPSLTEGSTTNQLSVDLGANLRVKDTAVVTALGNPFQAGGSIGNTSFGISGSLPGFASPPTVNLGTIGGVATETSTAAIGTALGAVTASPTANTIGDRLKTLATNQGSQLTQETAINTVLGTATASPAANTLADRLKTIGTNTAGLANAVSGSNFNVICTSGCSGSASPFVAGGQANLSVSTSSARVALPSADPVAILTNTGASSLFFKFGSSSVTAATTDIFLAAGQSVAVGVNSQAYIAAITPSSVSTLQITTGAGSPVITAPAGSGGGGGGGGAVTVADGADVAQGSTSDAAATAGSTGSNAAKLRLMTSQLDQLHADNGAQGTGSTFNPPTGGSGVIGYLSGIFKALGGLHVTVDSAPTTAVTVASLPLPTGAATNQPNVAQDSGGAVSLIQAAGSGAISVASSGTTQLLALSSGKKIYLTEYDFAAAGTVNVTLYYGTGTNCATGKTALTGAYPLTAQNGVVVGNGLGPVRVIPSGNALCIDLSASTGVYGGFAYSQF
jgi:hypothetical protein